MTRSSNDVDLTRLTHLNSPSHGANCRAVVLLEKSLERSKDGSLSYMRLTFTPRESGTTKVAGIAFAQTAVDLDRTLRVGTTWDLENISLAPAKKQRTGFAPWEIKLTERSSVTEVLNAGAKEEIDQERKSAVSAQNSTIDGFVCINDLRKPQPYSTTVQVTGEVDDISRRLRDKKDNEYYWVTFSDNTDSLSIFLSCTYGSTVQLLRKAKRASHSVTLTCATKDLKVSQEKVTLFWNPTCLATDSRPVASSSLVTVNSLDHHGTCEGSSYPTQATSVFITTGVPKSAASSPPPIPVRSTRVLDEELSVALNDCGVSLRLLTTPEEMNEIISPLRLRMVHQHPETAPPFVRSIFQQAYQTHILDYFENFFRVFQTLCDIDQMTLKDVAQAIESQESKMYKECVPKMVFPEVPLIRLGQAKKAAGRGVEEYLALNILRHGSPILHRMSTLNMSKEVCSYFFGLVGLFCPGFSTDMFGDMTTFLLLPLLLSYTDAVCLRLQKLIDIGQIKSTSIRFSSRKWTVRQLVDYIQRLPVRRRPRDAGNFTQWDEDRLSYLEMALPSSCVEFTLPLSLFKSDIDEEHETHPSSVPLLSLSSESEEEVEDMILFVPEILLDGAASPFPETAVQSYVLDQLRSVAGTRLRQVMNEELSQPASKVFHSGTVKLLSMFTSEQFTEFVEKYQNEAYTGVLLMPTSEGVRSLSAALKLLSSVSDVVELPQCLPTNVVSKGLQSVFLPFSSNEGVEMLDRSHAKRPSITDAFSGEATQGHLTAQSETSQTSQGLTGSVSEHTSLAFVWKPTTQTVIAQRVLVTSYADVSVVEEMDLLLHGATSNKNVPIILLLQPSLSQVSSTSLPVGSAFAVSHLIGVEADGTIAKIVYSDDSRRLDRCIAEFCKEYKHSHRLRVEQLLGHLDNPVPQLVPTHFPVGAAKTSFVVSRASWEKPTTSLTSDSWRKCASATANKVFADKAIRASLCSKMANDQQLTESSLYLVDPSQRVLPVLQRLQARHVSILCVVKAAETAPVYSDLDQAGSTDIRRQLYKAMCSWLMTSCLATLPVPPPAGMTAMVFNDMVVNSQWVKGLEQRCLTFCSFNCKWLGFLKTKEVDELASFLLSQKFDVICIQEVTSQPFSSVLSDSTAAPVETRYSAKSFCRLIVKGGFRACSPGEDVGKSSINNNSTSSEYPLMFYNPMVLDHTNRVGFLSGERIYKSSVEKSFRYVPFAAVLRTICTPSNVAPKDITIISVHCTPDDDPLQANARELEMTKIAEWIASRGRIHGTNSFVILMGDFNTYSQSEVDALCNILSHKTQHEFMTLNCNPLRTTNIAETAPFDHFFLPSRLLSSVVRDSTNGPLMQVLDLKKAFPPPPGTAPLDGKMFQQKYSDHHPIAFGINLW